MFCLHLYLKLKIAYNHICWQNLSMLSVLFLYFVGNIHLSIYLYSQFTCMYVFVLFVVVQWLLSHFEINAPELSSAQLTCHSKDRQIVSSKDRRMYTYTNDLKCQTNTYIHIYIYIHTCINMYIHAYVHTYLRTSNNLVMLPVLSS